MATPTSHPRPSPQKHPPTNHLTPPSTTDLSPRSKNLTPSKRFAVPNGHIRQLSATHKMSDTSSSAGTLQGAPMSRSATNASSPSFTHAGAPMSRSATNATTTSHHSTPPISQAALAMARGASSAANTPTPARTVTSSGQSPTATAAAGMLMQEMGGKTPMGVFGSPNIASSQAQTLAGTSAAIPSFIKLSKEEQDAERRRKLERIAEMVGKHWGYAGQEGVEQAAKRLGLETMWADHVGRGGQRGLSIAGTTLLIDVDFRGDEILGLGVESSGVKFGDRWKKAAHVLNKALAREQHEGYITLDDFVSNLERLARLDKIGGESNMNCFDAIEGVARGLDLLYAKETDHEEGMKEGQKGKDVMCKRSGKPFWHGGNTVGFAVQFWQDQCYLSETTPSIDAMEVDDPAELPESPKQNEVWRATIGCELCPADTYIPARISESWLAETEQSQMGESPLAINNTKLSWLDPPRDIEPGPSQTDGETERASTVRFIAKLEPVIICPIQTALHIHTTLNDPIQQETILPTSFESLLFADLDDRDPLQPPPTPRISERKITHYNPSTDTSTTHHHRATLFTSPQDLARPLTTLPFAHPMDIINILPTLRQWALVSSILRRSFTPTAPISDPPSPANSTTNGAPPPFQTLDDELADFLASPLLNRATSTTATTSFRGREINVSFTTTAPLSDAAQLDPRAAVPQFQAHFPNPRWGGNIASVGFAIGLNGVVEGVVVDDGRGSGMDMETEESVKEREGLAEKVRKVIEIAEDIGVVVEWVCGGVGERVRLEGLGR